VHYPGLPSHPNHAIALRQQSKFGGVVSFSLKHDHAETAKQLVGSTQLFKLAESLGGVKSLLCHPATMTHASIPAERRRQAGVKDSLVRLSCGIEHPEDLINDLRTALDALVPQRETTSIPALQFA
jgi:cystathionine beta-lyase